MKKKIFTLIVAGVFFLSITALPIIIHKCNGIKLILTGKCGMNSYRKISGKCSGNGEVIGFSNNNNDNCCSTQLKDLSIKDNFVKAEFQRSFNHIKIIFITNDNYLCNTNKDELICEENPPPFPHINEIYLFNSIFLI